MNFRFSYQKTRSSRVEGVELGFLFQFLVGWGFFGDFVVLVLVFLTKHKDFSKFLGKKSKEKVFPMPQLDKLKCGKNVNPSKN